MWVFSLSILLVSILLILFFLASKQQKWDELSSTSFECGFHSYFFSRFSFSIHYFIVGLIFLFLDLELCMLMPVMGGELGNLKLLWVSSFFMTFLLGGLILEWAQGHLDWKL